MFMSANRKTGGTRRYPRKSLAMALLALFCAEIIVTLPGIHFASADPGPDDDWDGTVSEWFAVKNPARFRYKWHGCNGSYLMLDIKDTSDGTDYLNFTVDGEEYVATFGHNAWGLDLPVENWTDPACERQVHEICFTPGSQHYIDSAWVQPAILASGNATGTLESFFQIPFFAGGDVVICLQPEGSYLDLGVEVTDGPNETETVTLKRTDYQDLYPGPIPDTDCATVAGAIEGRLANRFETHLQYPGNHTLRVRTSGAFDYTVVAGGGVDIDGDKLTDAEEAENYGEAGYHPLVPSAWAFRIGEADHPTFWDFLYSNSDTLSDLNITAYQESLNNTHFSAGMALFIPSSWRSQGFQAECLALYADVEAGAAENFTLDGAPAYFNDTVWGFDFVSTAGIDILGQNDVGTQVVLPTDGMMSFTPIFLGYVQPGWHTVGWWVDAEAAVFLDTRVNLRINQYSVPILEKTWADQDADNLADEWEVLHGMNPGNVDTDGDEMSDPVDVSQDASLFLPAGTINQVILPVTPGKDARITIQVHPPALDLTKNASLEWNPPGSTGIGTQVTLVPGLRIYGSGNSEEVDYWANRAGLATFWEKGIATYALADVPSNTIEGDAGPLPTTATGAGQYYTFLLPDDVTPYSWQFTLQLPADFPPLVTHHYIDLRFDLVYLLVTQAWQNASDQSILRWYEVEEPLLLQGISVTEVGDVAWALGSTDNAEETSVIFSTVVNPALGNPTNYGLTGATAPNPDVIGWGAGQLLYPSYNPDPANSITLSVADRIAAVRKLYPRGENEAEVTYYGCTEHTYDALGWLNKSAQVDPNSGQVYCAYPGNDFVNIPDNNPLPAIRGWTVDPVTRDMGLARVRRNAQSRAKVAELAPYYTIPAIAAKNASGAASEGVTEFWVYRPADDAPGKVLNIELLDAAGQVAAQLQVNNATLQVYNYTTSSWVEVGEIWDGEWFQVIVDFNCTAGTSDVVVGGVSCDWAPGCGLAPGASGIQQVRFTAQGAPFVIDGVQFSWDASYDPSGPEFFNALLGSDTTRRHAWYTISDIYGGRYEADDPMLAGEDVVAWETYWSNDLHEERRCVMSRFPVDIDFIRANEANAWTPNPALDGFIQADCLKVTSVVGDILPVYLPTTFTSIENEQNQDLKHGQGALIYLYDYKVEPFNDEIPPSVNYDILDEEKLQINLREHTVDRLRYWFEPRSYSLWKQWLGRVDIMEYYIRRDALAVDHYIQVLNEYFTEGGAHCAHPLDIQWPMQVPIDGILITDRVREYIQSLPGEVNSQNPIYASTPPELLLTVYCLGKTQLPLHEIPGLSYNVKDGTYRIKGIKKGPNKFIINCRLTAPVLNKWALDYKESAQLFLQEVKLPLGSPIEVMGYQPTPNFGSAASMNQVRIKTYLDYSIRVQILKAAIKGKTENYGPGYNYFLKIQHETYRRIKGYLLNGVPVIGKQLEMVDFNLQCALNRKYGGFAWLLYSPTLTDAPTLTGGTYKCMVDRRGRMRASTGHKAFIAGIETLKDMAPKCAKSKAEANQAIAELDNIQAAWKSSMTFWSIMSAYQKLKQSKIRTDDMALYLGDWEFGILQMTSRHIRAVSEYCANYLVEKLATRMGITILDKNLMGVLQSASLTQEILNLLNKDIKKAEANLRIVLENIVREWVPDITFEYFQQLKAEVFQKVEELSPALMPVLNTIITILNDILAEGLGQTGHNPWIKKIQAGLAKEARIQNRIERGINKILRKIAKANNIPFQYTEKDITGQDVTVAFNVQLRGALLKGYNPAYDLYYSMGRIPAISPNTDVYYHPLTNEKYLGNPNWGYLPHKYGFYGPLSAADIRRMNRGLEYAYLYDGYIGPEVIPFDPALMAWMWASRSHGRLTPSNVEHDIARQWLTIAQQVDYEGEEALVTGIQQLAGYLLTWGLIQGAVALVSAAIGMAAVGTPAAVQGAAQALGQQAAQAVEVFAGGFMFWSPDFWNFDLSTPEGAENLFNLLNTLEMIAGFAAGGLGGLSVVSGVLSIVNLAAAGVLYAWSAWYNQTVEVLSHIYLTQGFNVNITEAVKRNLIKNGALQAGDPMTFSLTANNTGHKINTITDLEGFYWVDYSGDGGDFIFNSRVAISNGITTQYGWTPSKSTNVPAAFTIWKNNLLERDTPGGSVTHSETLTLPAANDPKLYYEIYYKGEVGDPTTPEIKCIGLAQYGIAVTEPTLAEFLADCRPSERSTIENKTWEFLEATWEGRFKDAGDAVDQVIAAIGFTPEQFNATFGNAIPNYQGMVEYSDLHVDRCLDCGAPFNKTLGHCGWCGWKLDHYGVFVPYAPVWHDLMTRYFAEGFRALRPTPGGTFFTPTVEWQASEMAHSVSNGMILVPADWLARKNQSLPLLRALCAARANFTLNANLDVTPSWGGILEVPANGTASGRLYFTVEGPDNPAVKADLILPDGFAGALYTGHYKGTESFTAGIDGADWILDWTWGNPNVSVTPWYLDHRNVMCIDDNSPTKTIRAGYDFVNKPQERGTVEFWVANPNTGPDQALSWSLDESTYFYNYYPLITGMLKAGQIWTTNGASQVVVGTYDPTKWVHVRVAFGDPRVPLTYPYAFNYSLWIDGEFAGEFTYTHPADYMGTFRGLSFFSTTLGTGSFYVDAIGCDFAPGYHVGDNWHLEDVPGEEVFPLQDLPSLEFAIHPLSSHTPAGFYTATVNITYTNGTRIMTITIPFRYAWDQRTGLEFIALPDTVIPGDVVRWGKVINTGTEPGAFLVDADGFPADWLQSTGRVALAHVGFDQGLDGFTLASASSGAPNFTITQPIQVATYVNPSAPDTCFGASSLIVPGIAQWAYFGVPNLSPNTPFVAPRGTSAFFFMDYAEHDAPFSTWDLFPAPSLDEGTLTWANVPDMGEWWKNLLYKQPAAFAYDWVQFPNLTPGGTYILQQGLSRFRLRSDDFPDIATRPFAGTTYDKVLANAGMLVLQTNEPETITLTKPVTWALQAGDTITIRYSISGPGHVTLTLDGQSFEIIRAGNTQYGSQSKSLTLPQNLTAPAITLDADLAAGTVFRVDTITAERPLTLSQQASNGIAGGIYNGTIDLHDAIGFTSLASYAFDSGTEGWTGSFASGEKNFTVTDYMALTYVDQRNPGSSFKGPEIVLSSSSYYMYAYLMDAYRERYFPGFIPEEILLQLRFQHVVPATLWAWACNPWDPVNYNYNGQPLSYDNQPWYFGKVVTSAATTGIPDGGWLTVHGMAPGPFFLFTDQLFGTMEVYGPSSFNNYPRTITVFENFGAAEGHLLFQADQPDSFSARRAVDLQLRQGDRVRVTFTTTGTQLVTLRVGSATFTLVPAGNSVFGSQEAVFTIPADMHVTQLEIAGYLDAVQYLHVDTIAIERPAQVLPYVYGHWDVLALGAAAGGVTGAEYAINSPLTGTVEMWVAGSNLTAPLAIELAGDHGIARLGFENEELRAWNGSTIITLANFSAWTGWTHLRVDFDLVTDSFTVWVNNVTVARDLLLTATGDVITLQSIRLATAPGDHSYFVDAIVGSWVDVTYNLGDNLWPAWAAGCEQLFFVAPGESRSLEITVPRLYSIAPGPRQFVAKVVDPVTRRLLGVYSGTVNVGAFYDIGLEVLPILAAGMPGTQSTYMVRATNLGNVAQTISLTCAGSTLAGWSFATSSATLAPGQTFASELIVDPAIFEAGVQWFTVLAGAALNSTVLGASYVVNDVPALSTPPDFSYESGTTGHEIRWDIEDTYLNSSVAVWNLSRAILGDISLPVANGSWNDSREITVPVDGLPAGTFVYELAIQDGFGGTTQDKLVLVVTQDGVAYLPQVNSTDAPAGENQVYATPLGNGTLEVAFNATAEVTLVVGTWDDNPTGLDPGFAGEGVYFAVEASDEAAVTFPMYVTVPLPAGIPPNATEQEIAEMIVPFTFDEVTGNWTQEDFAVTVDILNGTATVAVTHLSQFAVGVLNFPPTISCPPDLCFEVGTPGQAITWVVTDETVTRPMYQVTCNGMPLAGGPWQAGMPIVIPISEFEVGNYLLTASISDGRGATVTDDVQVTVQPAITNVECGAVPDTAAGITLKITAFGASAVVVEFNGEIYPTINAGNDYVAFLPNPQVIGAHAVRVTAWHGTISTTRDITIEVVNTVPRVRLYYASAASAGEYPATYTFSNRDPVPFSMGWVSGVQNIPGQPTPGVLGDYCRILPEFTGHTGVLQLFKNSSIAQVIAACFAGQEIPAGSVELWLAVEGDASFMAALSSFTVGISVWIVVVQGQLAFVSADGSVTWLGAFSPGWHWLKIDFAGAGTSIAGLAENHIALTLDDIYLDALDAGAPLHVTGFAAAASEIGNAPSPATGSLYLDAVGFSYDPNYILGTNKYPGIDLTPRAGEPSPVPEVTIEAGDPNAIVTWVPADLHYQDATYVLSRNGTAVDAGAWVGGTRIPLNLTALAPGNYYFEVSLADGLGGTATQGIVVHVITTAEGLLRKAIADIGLLEDEIAGINATVWRFLLASFASRAGANLAKALDLVLVGYTDRAAIRVWVARCQLRVADIITWVGDHVGGIDPVLANRLHERIGSITAACGTLLDLLAGE